MLRGKSFKRLFSRQKGQKKTPEFSTDVSSISTTCSSCSGDDDSELLFLNRFLGMWKLIKPRSDSMDEVSKAMGVSWAVRRAIEQFTPTCRYSREGREVTISQLLPMNKIKNATLYIDDEEHCDKDNDIGEWVTTTAVDLSDMSIVTQRCRTSDDVKLTEIRRIITEGTFLNGNPNIRKDVLWYFVEVRKSKDGPVVASSNRFYSREEDPPEGTRLPWTRNGSDPELVESLDELLIVVDPSNEQLAVKEDGKPVPFWMICCSCGRPSSTEMITFDESSQNVVKEG